MYIVYQWLCQTLTQHWANRLLQIQIDQNISQAGSGSADMDAPLIVEDSDSLQSLVTATLWLTCALLAISGSDCLLAGLGGERCICIDWPVFPAFSRIQCFRRGPHPYPASVPGRQTLHASQLIWQQASTRVNAGPASQTLAQHRPASGPGSQSSRNRRSSQNTLANRSIATWACDSRKLQATVMGGDKDLWRKKLDQLKGSQR